MNLVEKNKNNLIIFFFLIIGLYISLIRGSNFSDGDSFSVILSFLDYIDFNKYTPSRGAYGHPIPELFIGSLSYFLGTPFSNLFCFLLFFSSIIILSKTFFEDKIKKNIFIFLVLSNFLLFTENTNSIDYPIALFFFSLGLFYNFKNKYLLSSFFFALTIASRLNFAVFIFFYFFIEFLLDKERLKNFYIYFSIAITIIIINCIFYFPVFYTNDYSFSFIKLPFINSSTPGWYGGPELSLKNLLPRFIFKTYLISGVFSFFFIFFIFLVKKEKFFLFFKKENLFLTLIIIINLTTFYFMPTKTLIINPFIIFLYIFIVKNFDKKIIYVIIFLNLLQWVVSYKFLDITYKKQEICWQKEAIDASFTFKIIKGDIFRLNFKNQELAKCYSKSLRDYKINFEKGKALILSR